MLSKPASSPPRQLLFAGCNVVPRTSATVLLYSTVFRRCMPFVPGSSTWTAPPDPGAASAPWPPVPPAAPGDPPAEQLARPTTTNQQVPSRTSAPAGDRKGAAGRNLETPEGGLARIMSPRP